MLDQILGSTRVISLATKTNFRGINLREVALFQGPHGWAEFSPFLEYDENESVPWLTSAIEAAFMAPPKSYRSEIRINATIPALNDHKELSALIDSYGTCDSVKVKVGDNLSEDIMRITRVRTAMPKAEIRLDVNGGWNVTKALRNLYAIYEEVGPLEYIEQPCSTLEELRELKSKLVIPIKIMGDEVLRKISDPCAIDLSDAVDLIMLKVAPLGGITRCHEIAAHHKLPVVVSSALESAVGISYGLKLASTIINLDYACGLGTGNLLAQDVAHLPIKNGVIELVTVSPDSATLTNLEVAPERLEWWKNRIRRTWIAGAEKVVRERGWVA